MKFCQLECSQYIVKISLPIFTLCSHAEGWFFSAPLVKAWFELSKDRMTEEDLKTVERASMIDLTNEHQMEILYEYYHMNFETIAFWVPGWSWLQKYKSFVGKLLNPSMFFF